MRKDSKVPRVYSTEDGAFPKRAPIGIYDPGILCASCDNRIGDWDNYAQSVLLTPLEDYGNPAILKKQESFSIPAPDYARLKLFFIALLWRADQSTHEFFDLVDLGPWREKARTMLLRTDPGEPNKFGVLLVRYEHPLAAGTFYHPRPIRSEGVNCYRFSLGSYVAMIKVDRRPFDDSRELFLLRSGGDLRVGLFDYEESRIYSDVIEEIKAGGFKLGKRSSKEQNPGPQADG